MEDIRGSFVAIFFGGGRFMNEKHLIWAKKQYEKISDLQHDLELLNDDKKKIFILTILKAKTLPIGKYKDNRGKNE